MRRIILFLSVVLSGCLPNPQSEWVSSEGGEQRSTLGDETISPQANCDVEDTYDYDGARSGHVYVAHPRVSHVRLAHLHVASHRR